jgi:HSP20 family protein
MADESEVEPVREAEIRKLSIDPPFFELTREINELIARRAYELFESRGFEHGQDREDWLRAQSEILVNVPVDIMETHTGFTIRADVPGFAEQDLQVRVAPRALCITGKRQEASDRKEGKAVSSERHANQIFRVFDLPYEIDPDRVDATLNDGALVVTLLKVATGKEISAQARVVAA